jgi:hypothetical protein
VPHFGLEAVAPLADFIEQRYLQASTRPGLEILVGGRRHMLDPQVEAVFVRVVRSLLGDCGDPSAELPIELRIPGQMP